MLEFVESEYDYICKKAMLYDHELKLDKIFYMKIKGYSRQQIADELHISLETVTKRTKILNKKILKVTR